MNQTSLLTFQDKLKYFYDDNPYSEIPDIFDLFRFYNQFFFQEHLTASILRWSKKMTLCAGTCSYQGMMSCVITLSEPLLKFRSNNELKETLLHELIHAFLFITDPLSCRIEEGHGPKFLELMHQINRDTQLNLSVYHQFHDEVDRCRQHIWKCDGPCQQRQPFYGIVKRAMNRPPQKADTWFTRHQSDCGGTFHKIQEPSKPIKEKPIRQTRQPKKQKDQSQIQEFFKTKKIEGGNNIIILIEQEEYSINMTLQSSLLTTAQFHQFYSKLHQVLLENNVNLLQINECSGNDIIDSECDLIQLFSSDKIQFKLERINGITKGGIKITKFDLLAKNQQLNIRRSIIHQLNE